MPNPTPPEASRRVTLSDGSEWTFVPHANDWIGEMAGDTPRASLVPQLWRGGPLTAADHRAIANVLDPPAAPSSGGAPPSAGKLYWPTDPSYPCPTCGHRAAPQERGQGTVTLSRIGVLRAELEALSCDESGMLNNGWTAALGRYEDALSVHRAGDTPETTP